MSNQELIARYQDKFADKTIQLWTIVISDSYGNVVVTEIFDICDDNIKSYVIGEQTPHGEPLDVRYKTWSGNVGIEDIKQVIWLPLTRGRLTQEVEYTATNDDIIRIVDKLQRNLKVRRMLDKTIYDRVQIEEIKTILLEIMTKRDD